MTCPSFSAALGAVALIFVAEAHARADRQLTLPEALQLARTNNKDLAASRARLQQAFASVEQARVPLIPQVTAGGSYTHNYKEVDLALSKLTEPSVTLAQLLGSGFSSPVNIPSFTPAEDAQLAAHLTAPLSGAMNKYVQTLNNEQLPDIVIQKQNALAGQVTVTAPLVVPGAYPAIAAANRNYEASEAGYRVTESLLLFSTAQAFYAAAGSDEILQARKHAVDVAQKTLHDAQSRLEAGTTNKLEVMRAQLALDQAEQSQREAIDADTASYRALATILVLPEPFQVAPPELPAVRKASNEELVHTALTLRPDFLQLQRSLDAAHSSTQASWLKLAPTLSAFGNANLFNYASFSGDKYAWAFGAQLSWVLFDGTLTMSQRHLAEAQAEEDELRLASLRATLADDLLNAQDALVTKRAAVDTAERAVSLSEETLKLVRSQHEVGTATQLDLLQAQDALVSAEVRRAQARFDLAMSDISLRRTAGTFPADAIPSGEHRD